MLGWMKSVGDEVALGDELVEIETDKANMVYEADVAGTLIEIIAEEGATLPIGEVIARIGDAGEAPAGRPVPLRTAAGADQNPTDEVERPRAARAARQAQRGSRAGGQPRAPAATDGERIKASPLARRMARDQGVDLASLTGSGPGGRIVKADVESGAGRRRRPPRSSRQPRRRGPGPAPPSGSRRPAAAPRSSS